MPNPSWLPIKATCTMLLVCALTCAPATRAQSSANENQDQTNQQLLERIRQLEAKVKQLEGRGSSAAQEPTPEPILPPSPENTVAPRLKLNVLATWAFRPQIGAVRFLTPSISVHSTCL